LPDALFPVHGAGDGGKCHLSKSRPARPAKFGILFIYCILTTIIIILISIKVRDFAGRAGRKFLSVEKRGVSVSPTEIVRPAKQKFAGRVRRFAGHKSSKDH
jgi:hypothetical protein